MSTARKTQIVVVGGGAAGLELATRLGAHFGRENFDCRQSRRGTVGVYYGYEICAEWSSLVPPEAGHGDRDATRSPVTPISPSFHSLPISRA